MDSNIQLLINWGQDFKLSKDKVYEPSIDKLHLKQFNKWELFTCFESGFQETMKSVDFMYPENNNQTDQRDLSGL